MTVYRRKLLDYTGPARGLAALALLALASLAFAGDPAPLPKADPIQITPIAPTPMAAPAAASAPAVTSPAAATAAKNVPAQGLAVPAKSGPISVTVNGAQAVKTSMPVPADPNEAVRQAIRERMQGSGELVIRSVDAASAIAAPAKSSSPPVPSSKPVESRTGSAKAAPMVPWSYDGDRGPANWGKLHARYAACDKGQFQSPIDLRDGVGVDLPELTFDVKPSLFKVIDTGKTLEVHYLSGASMRVLGNTYRLMHLEFRHPAEERIEGKTHGMSMQLHFRDGQGRLAAVSVLLSPIPGKENPFIQSIWNHIPLVRNEAVAPPELMINLGQVLPRKLSYYTYMGSLTTPPCTEGVTWYVLKTPIEVSSDQIAIFARLYPNNTRPVQPANSRLIKESRS